ncbi:ATP-binding protein [Aquincola sp. MAHUQ-54]|uniref:histidine kinase n=1 Tax=Aquincola agrisoli TaxID=3119538 RepID=A0AAW9QPB0_9BURK
MSIRLRLLTLVFAVWLPAAAGFGLLAWYTHEEQAAATLEQVEQFGLAVSTVVERELDKRVILARALAASNAARDGDFAQFHEEARNATQGTSDWALLAEADRHLVNTRAPLPFDPVPRVKPAPLTQREPHVMFVQQGPVARKPVITIFVPIPGASPQRYNVGVSFEPAVLQQILDATPPPFRGLVVVVDNEQVIMARSRDPEKWFGVSASPGFQQRILRNGTGFAASTTLDGVPSMTYLTPRSAYGWSVVVSVPMTELDAAAQRASAKAVAAAAVLLVIGLGLALLGARRISHTVDALRTSAALLGDNRVPERLNTGLSEVDEVGETLHAAGMKASEANQVLERRVLEAVQQAQEAQTRLLQGQKLEAIGRLTAGVAHDFNNLLQTIKTAHHVLGRSIAHERDRRVLEGAVRATSKASDLVKQLMTFGRVQTLLPTAVNLADVVLKGHELTRTAVGSSIVLSASLEPGLPDVHADPVQLEMALLNLVFNARDALPSGGRITIGARQAAPEETQHLGEGRFVRLEVADDGAGMSEEVRTRAFEPYFTTKPVGSGSGIGLAQVHAFARQSGGDITLSSELGAGTRVCLFLPVAACGAAAPAPSPSGAPLHSALHLLVVEDDALIASVTTGALEAEGYAVRLCTTADEAMAVLRGGEQFDVLFTDVVMPGKLNGLDLVRWCAAERPGLPVVVTTGYAENLNSISAEILRKPYDIEALIASLERAHAGPAAPPPRGAAGR